MDRNKQMAMLEKVLEIQFVAIELNLYLDTHPCDQDALNDYNCAVELLIIRGREWQWSEGPWPWEM
ncbi:MAG: CotJB protein [Anaerospora sp.]|nr:CotJB protein [Anaerospora sp.]